MSEHASGASSTCQPESPSYSTAPLRNSRDCKAYLLSLPNGEAALHHSIKQAKQSVHSKVGAIVCKHVQQTAAPGATSHELSSAAGRQGRARADMYPNRLAVADAVW